MLRVYYVGNGPRASLNYTCGASMSQSRTSMSLCELMCGLVRLVVSSPFGRRGGPPGLPRLHARGPTRARAIIMAA